MGNLKLFVVYLGGRAEGCNTELHDTVFVVGNSIEEAYPSLVEKWFGTRLRLHIDCYAELKYIDGYEIHLRSVPPEDDKRLFFINYGAYAPGVFSEVHEVAFYVEGSRQKAIHRARKNLCKGLLEAHLDDGLEVREIDIDDCYVHLTKTVHPNIFNAKCGYIKL